jgi:hypothetical protein
VTPSAVRQPNRATLKHSGEHYILCPDEEGKTGCSHRQEISQGIFDQKNVLKSSIYNFILENYLSAFGAEVVKTVYP